MKREYQTPFTSDERALRRVVLRYGWTNNDFGEMFLDLKAGPPSRPPSNDVQARGRAAFRRGGARPADERAVLRLVRRSRWSQQDAEGILGFIQLGPAAAASGPRAQDGALDIATALDVYGQPGPTTRELTILPDGGIFVALSIEEAADGDGPHPRLVSWAWDRAVVGPPEAYGLPLPIVADRPPQSGEGPAFHPADEEYRSTVAAADAGDPVAQQVLAYLFSDRDQAVVPFGPVDNEESS